MRDLLKRLFGVDDEGEPMCYTHLSNYNRGLGGKKGSAARHGRWWLTLRRHGKATKGAAKSGGKPVRRRRDFEFSTEWLFFGRGHRFPGWDLELCDGGGDHDFALTFEGLGCFFHVGIGGVVDQAFRQVLGLYKPPRPGARYGTYQARMIGVRTFGGRCHVDLWGKPHMSNSTDPKWQSFSFSVDPRDILGRSCYTSEVIDTAEVEIPMPEGKYPATVEIRLDSWTRKHWAHWPTNESILRAHVDMKKMIPYPGKGENSWDCGEDGLCGSTFPAKSVEEAIGRIVGSALDTRKQRGVGHAYVPRKKDAA